MVFLLHSVKLVLQLIATYTTIFTVITVHEPFPVRCAKGALKHSYYIRTYAFSRKLSIQSSHNLRTIRSASERIIAGKCS